MSLDEFVPLDGFLASEPSSPDTTTDAFRGLCPVFGRELMLPRTRLSEEVARQVMKELPDEEPKMFGVLIAQSSTGQLGFLKAFSGKWRGASEHPGWVPSMLDLAPSPLEISTKRRLQEMKASLQDLAETEAYRKRHELTALWRSKETELREQLRRGKHLRDTRRGKGEPESVLAAESKEDSRRKREFKARYGRALAPLRDLERQIDSLKKERRALSRALQAEMHARFEAGLWKQKPWSLASLFSSGPPTGTGECCAPKLLHFARRHNLRPIALAEFWWGESTEMRQQGRFYAPCTERCQPLLGPLLTDAIWSLQAVYHDQDIVVVDKPSGLLTVPGREVWTQDSLVTRLQSDWGELHAVHRLDLETSGLVVLARNVPTLGVLQKQFAERRITKVYQALLLDRPDTPYGRVEEPIGQGPNGRYRLDPKGKPAVTDYRVLNSEEARVELRPLTGRSHQLRVHCAEGLGRAIVGDPIYGRPDRRLMLHAREIRFHHSGRTIQLESPVPF